MYSVIIYTYLICTYNLEIIFFIDEKQNKKKDKKINKASPNGVQNSKSKSTPKSTPKSKKKSAGFVSKGSFILYL